MIQFSCFCGHAFTVDDDQAGGTVQCPDCRKLNDIPQAGDLAGLGDDGTFNLTEPPVKPDPDRLGELTYIYHKGTTDADGNDIDLRPTPEDLLDVGAEIPLKDEGPAPARRKPAPKYDPETGELIREFAVKADDRLDAPPEAVPLAKPAISYATKGRTEQVAPGGTGQQLLQPGNLVVMACVFGAHAFGGFIHLFLVGIAAYVAAMLDLDEELPVWLLNVLFWLVVAHYGNTIQDTGPELLDELPRPLRHLGFIDDILGPLFKVLTAVVLCYLPMFVAMRLPWPLRLSALPCMAVGAAAFPAVLLTTVTSGSLANLRVDRLLNVVREGGTKYVGLAALWFVLFPVYLLAFLGVNVFLTIFAVKANSAAWASKIYVYLPLAVAAIYFAHYFCWQLGLLHRGGHDRFGWVWQELERDRAERRKLKAAAEATRATRLHGGPAAPPAGATQVAPVVGRPPVHAAGPMGRPPYHPTSGVTR